MAAALAVWYNNQYAPWNRTRRLQLSPFLARADTNASRTAAEIIQANPSDLNTGAVAIPMSDNGLTDIRQEASDGKLKDTLFGPSIGVVNPGPGWAHSAVGGGVGTSATDGKVPAPFGGDVLTTDVVKKWVAKSKETSEPTTTLQALVNLKRPSIRLQPLEAAPHSANDDNLDSHPHSAEHHQTQQHGLEFEFDCDAPKCGIYLYVNCLPTSVAGHPGVGEDTGNSNMSRMLVFEAVVPGGFGRKLALAEGAILELEKFEMLVTDAIAASAQAASLPSSSSVVASASGISSENVQHRKRLTFFRHNNKQQRPSAAHSRPAAGPALALVDAESNPMSPPMPNASTSTSANPAEKKAHSEMDEGVKVTIRLVALDEEGREIKPSNEQVTYLHVVRLGIKPTLVITVPNAPSANDATEGTKEDVEKENEEAAEDTRPWVVRVIKREAIIGIHTFHLHEIYGLASHTNNSTSPIATLPTTYPPHSPTAEIHADEFDQDAPSECLLCLSSPREVVLLPCRHLVACRECAINMIEFGAGGTVTQQNENTDASTSNANGNGNTETETGQAEGSTPDGEGEPMPPVTAPAPAPTTTRRKRKPKGWFCPVCRQPYTSMLRITTNPPPSNKSMMSNDEKKRMSGMSTDTTAEIMPVGDNVAVQHPLTAANQGVLPAPATQAAQPRPGFLRHFSRASGRNANGASEQLNGGAIGPDLERQA